MVKYANIVFSIVPGEGDGLTGNRNMRLSMMWPSVVTYIRHRMFLQEFVEGDIPIESIISLIFYILFNQVASSCVYAGWHVPDLVSPRTGISRRGQYSTRGYNEVCP